MTTPPSVQAPPCDRCGLPIVEAHYRDGRCASPPGRSPRRRAALAVTGGVAGLIVVVVAAIGLGGLMRPGFTVRTGFWAPSRPAVTACNEYYRWQQAAGLEPNVKLLSYAAAQADKTRFGSQSRMRLSKDLDALRAWNREAAYTASAPTTINYEQAIMADCASIMAQEHEQWPPPPPRNDRPLVPTLQACKLFRDWLRNPRNPSLLDRALADSFSPRVPENFSSRLRGELDGLANWARVAASVRAPKVVRREHAIQVICAPVIANYRRAQR